MLCSRHSPLIQSASNNSKDGCSRRALDSENCLISLLPDLPSDQHDHRLNPLPRLALGFCDDLSHQGSGVGVWSPGSRMKRAAVVPCSRSLPDCSGDCTIPEQMLGGLQVSCAQAAEVVVGPSSSLQSIVAP